MAEGSVPGIRQKGKIPATEWGKILARRNAGEPLTRIARDYGCTAPAIRYIVTRMDAGSPRSEGGTAGAAQQTGRGQAAGGPTAPSASAASKWVMPLDPAVRDRVTGEIAKFLYALDEVSASPGRGGIGRLRLASDNLMRAAARLRIELERIDPLVEEPGDHRPAHGPGS